MIKLLLVIVFVILFWPSIIFARTTPEDIYQEKRTVYEEQLNKIDDVQTKEKIIKADKLLNEINQTVCSRFDSDIAKITAILEELKRREDVTETLVAYGQGNGALDNAAYWVNYAAEAIAYQKIQDYTPQINPSNPAAGITTSQTNLRSSLVGLQQKIIKAKAEIKKALR